MPPITDAFIPPTTSLYQFTALSGVVVFLFLQYLMFSLYKFTNGKSSEARLASASSFRILRKAKDSHSSNLQRMNETNAALEKARADCEKVETEAISNASDPSLGAEIKRLALEVPRLLVLAETYRTEVAATSSLISEAEYEKELFGLKVDEYTAAVRQLWTLMLIWVIFSLLSIDFACEGFKLWYSKIQIYQDSLLKWQAQHPAPPK